MPKYVLKCDKCQKTKEVICPYKDVPKKCECGGELKIQVGYCNIITRIRKWKKYYPNIGGRVESGK